MTFAEWEFFSQQNAMAPHSLCTPVAFMTRGKNSLSDVVSSDLRERAESLLSTTDAPSAADDVSSAELVRELQLQRIELELQNEDLRRNQAQLEASKRQFADLYFNAPVGYITLDCDGRIGELNYLAAELLGANRDSLSDTDLIDCISPDSQQTLQTHLKEVFDSAGVHQCELNITVSPSVTTRLKMISVALDDDDNQEIQCRAALFDITEQYRTQCEKEEIEEQLHESHRMETLGRLASGIAHDFNNLLTLIIGYSKLAINHLPDGHPLEKHVCEIHKAGHHASELIEQLLAFSRSDESNTTPVAINELITDVDKMFNRLIGDDIELQLRLHDRLGEVYFDASQFQQVLLNLVVNARDAMSDGGHLIIRTRNIVVDQECAGRLDLETGPYVLIEVEDNGDGIPPDVIPHIFEPFFTTKTNDGHHGFGLSTTYGIVARHNGAIDIDSRPGEGSIFYVYLPRTDVDDSIHESMANKSAVLVVDDQPDLRDFASLVLEEMDVDVLSAHCPKEALQLSRTYSDELDLVVTDVTMPGMSGPELFEQIRSFHPDTKVLYISGYDRNRLQLERNLDPDAPFMEKPFTPNRLKDWVEELLNESTSRCNES